MKKRRLEVRVYRYNCENGVAYQCYFERGEKEMMSIISIKNEDIYQYDAFSDDANEKHAITEFLIGLFGEDINVSVV